MSDAKPYTVEDLPADWKNDSRVKTARLRATVEALERVTRERDSYKADADKKWGASATARANLQSAVACATDTALGLHLELERLARLHTEERVILRETMEQFGRERDEARAALRTLTTWLSQWRHAVTLRAIGAERAWAELEVAHNEGCRVLAATPLVTEVKP